MYVSDVDLRVIAAGQDATFHAGVPRPLRPTLVEAALKMGVRPVDQPADKTVAGTGGQCTKAQIMDAIVVLLNKGDKADFDKTGKPRVAALEAILGVNISSRQRDEAWDAVAHE
ncbi:hypothetical protein KDA14_05145 [Candidatus Saccharibacteria bacterium]|nr:hypothetical protein [Candidatus Saccharibacteria bacterium]